MSAAQRADHNRQKKIAAVNDLTGFGRCSLTVQIPIISRRTQRSGKSWG